MKFWRLPFKFLSEACSLVGTSIALLIWGLIFFGAYKLIRKLIELVIK